MKLAVVTDSTAYLPERIKTKENLFTIPIPVILDGKIYNEGIDIEADEYYDLLKNSKEFPTTSQPALGEVLALYQKIADKGYDTIISIHLSAGISGFVSTLHGIKEAIDGVTIVPYDSEITSLPMGHMVEAALDMSETDASLDEILAKIDIIRDNTYAYLIVDDLNNLVRGGRLTNGAALIGGLLKIKPILTFEEGKIVLSEKIRSTKKAFTRAEKIVGQRYNEIQYPVKLYVIHANNLEVAKEEKEKLQKQYPDAEIEIGHFGPVIGTHLGEKAIGLAISAQ
ncbi:DegV family EDD domain-containing protein [Enterococcus phoeniculicola]|jgi:DegV family protein with EDD domain|uniref:DegV family EDD domain-containing protein n=1 Tax=Enterococcus phoeniculicola ATCC BAA-412 TaxID=1158610 RepID=R3WFH9_9ENTE|nr:DegV family protein [Enterococcus phoeniculicola]EOL46222.1 DegV family EDD domain-containing protein [Enterococcus phoeniculicola ATCC BAA-412]EOT76933.1 DegV family EDD protein [Enterococcus phoeniculicola ATCC BAA-412]OJG71216.1 DegV family EDD domain-containing protein [Enterococcus phoeniculicola]